MAIMHTQPLGCIMAYDPTFKVDVSQHDPLHKLGMTERDILLDVMAVSAQLDLLFRKELSNSEKDRIDNGKVSRSFETKAMVMLKRVKTYIKRLPAPQPTPEDYMEISGLAKLYPRAATFVTRPNELSKASKSTNMDSYYAYLGNIHQLTTLAHQINSDVTNLVNHKYIAHQMVLLHQALGLFADNTILADLRKQIERNFEILKTTLTPEKEHEEVCLSSQHAQWVLDVTSSIVHEATSLPQNVAPKLFLPAQVLLNAS